MDKTIKLVILIFFSQLFGQIFVNGIPSGINLENNFHRYVTNIVDHDELLAEDLLRPSNTPYRYGKVFEIEIDFFEIATLEIVENRKIWRLGIDSDNAYALSIEFGSFFIDNESQLYIYSSDKKMIRGAYTSLNNNSENIFSTPLIKGDQIIIELNSLSNVINSNLIITQIVHDYRDILNFNNNDRNRGCGINTNCSEADQYENQINATSWLDMGGYICTGSMLNNVEQDLTPYYITAWHCTEGDNPSTFRFYFNYETNSCNGSFSSTGSYAYSSVMRANSGSMDGDFALLEITDNISDSWNVFYAGWRRNTSAPTIESGVHHPGGSPKKIIFDNDNAYSYGWSINWYGGGYSPPGSHWAITWDDGGTEGGSSGSPAYDNNGRFIGILSGGGNECSSSNSSGESYYGKFSYAWNFGSTSSSRLKDWLDPNNTGVYTIDGTYDGITIIYGCTDNMACNYNSSATDDNGTCIYPEENFDCNGDCIAEVDQCGICGGDGTSCLSPVNLNFGQQYNGYFDIILNSSDPISGFQFEINDVPDNIIITGASGGTAENNNFTVSTSENGVVLGFSFTGDVIPEGESVITQIFYEGEGNPELCLSNAVISDYLGNSFPVNYGNCITISGIAILSFGDISPGVVDIILDSNIPVAGFQFEITDTPNDLDIVGASGGSSEINNFTVSTSEDGVVLGFSFSGDTLPIGESLLLQLYIDGVGSPELCLSDGVISDIDANNLIVDYGNCVLAILSMPGDLNNDGSLNVVDIVTMVNLILLPESQTPELISIGDINNDGSLNVVDIVTLVGLILDEN